MPAKQQQNNPFYPTDAEIDAIFKAYEKDGKEGIVRELTNKQQKEKEQ